MNQSEREMMDVILSTHNESAQARLIGVSRGKLQKWKKDPGKIPFESVTQLAKLKGYKFKMETIPHTYS